MYIMLDDKVKNVIKSKKNNGNKLTEKLADQKDHKNLENFYCVISFCVVHIINTRKPRFRCYNSNEPVCNRLITNEHACNGWVKESG